MYFFGQQWNKILTYYSHELMSKAYLVENKLMKKKSSGGYLKENCSVSDKYKKNPEINA